MRYLHVYCAPSGQWSGKVLEEVAGIAGCEHPIDVLESALEQFEGIADLPKDAGHGDTAMVELHPKAVELLAEYAAAHDVDQRTYIEALVNYAISCERRPGSWEANRPFEFATYDKHGDVYADQWS